MSRKQHSQVEADLEVALSKLGSRGWVKDPPVPGSPDLALPDCSPPVAVFVDGCFWHGCPEHFKMPKTRSGYWRVKISRNRVRDRGVAWPCTHCGKPTGMLVEMGWIVVRLWEHEVNASPNLAAQKVLAEIEKARKGWGKGFGASS